MSCAEELAYRNRNLDEAPLPIRTDIPERENSSKRLAGEIFKELKFVRETAYVSGPRA